MKIAVDRYMFRCLPIRQLEPACESSVFMLEQIRTWLTPQAQPPGGALAAAGSR